MGENVAELQVTRIIRTEDGTTAFESLLAGPPTDTSRVLLPALASVAAPPDLPPAPQPSIRVSPARTDWLYRTWQAIEFHNVDAVAGLIDSCGGTSEVRSLLQRKFDVVLPHFTEWGDLRCTVEQIARVYAAMDRLVEAGVKIARIVQEFGDSAHQSPAGEFSRIWADASCQPHTDIHASVTSTVHDRNICAHLVLTAPKTGLAVAAQVTMGKGLRRRYGMLTDPVEQEVMARDLVTPWLTTGLRIGAKPSLVG